MTQRRNDFTLRGVSILVGMLMRYPEIGNMKYDPRRQTIRLNFLLSGAPAEEEFESARQALFNTLEVYHLLGQRLPAVLEISWEGIAELTAFSIMRDVYGISAGEVSLIVEFVRERFAGRLITEPVEQAGEEEIAEQDEIIEEILESIERSRGVRDLIAIREEGRVMVFRK